MPFKPFRPPLIRKPPQSPSQKQQSNESNSIHHHPPAKKRRISGEGDSGGNRIVHTASDGASNATDSVGSSHSHSQRLARSFGDRKPLITVKNPPTSSSVGLEKNDRNGSGTEHNDRSEAYYNVLWYVRTKYLELYTLEKGTCPILFETDSLCYF